MRKISAEVLAARKRVLAERKLAVDAYLRSLRDYKPQARYTREKFTPERSVGGPQRPRMDCVVGVQATPCGIAWYKGVNTRSNTDARKLGGMRAIGGPGDMRIQGKRLESQWTEPSTRITEYPLIDHVLCDGCGYRIDLRKHEYYNIGERILCDKCG